jgi:hypothetical protein
MNRKGKTNKKPKIKPWTESEKEKNPQKWGGGRQRREEGKERIKEERYFSTNL